MNLKYKKISNFLQLLLLIYGIPTKSTKKTMKNNEKLRIKKRRNGTQIIRRNRIFVGIAFEFSPYLSSNSLERVMKWFFVCSVQMYVCVWVLFVRFNYRFLSFVFFFYVFRSLLLFLFSFHTYCSTSNKRNTTVKWQKSNVEEKIIVKINVLKAKMVNSFKSIKT